MFKDLHDKTILVRRPQEDLSVEYKSWIDLSDKKSKAKIAKAAIALANSGGGFIVLGFSDNNGSLLPQEKPAESSEITTDIVNNCISQHCDPKFHCKVEKIKNEDNGYDHIIISVPGGITVPVMSAKGFDGEIKPNTCYIRKAGPRSEEPKNSSEWRDLLDRCVKAARDDLVDAFRKILNSGELQAKPNHPTLDKFKENCRNRWRHLTSTLPSTAPPRFPHGFYETALELTEAQTVDDLSEIKNAIELAGQLKFTGWPPFITSSSSEHHARVFGGMLECWLGAGSKNILDDPAHSDYWCASRGGDLYIIKGYTEDSLPEYTPGSHIFLSTPIWRIAEQLLFFSRFSEAIGYHGPIQIDWRFTGLKNRTLISNSFEKPLFENYCSETNQISGSIAATPKELDSNTAEFTKKIVGRVFECFNFLSPPDELFSSETRAMKTRAIW